MHRGCRFLNVVLGGNYPYEFAHTILLMPRPTHLLLWVSLSLGVHHPVCPRNTSPDNTRHICRHVHVVGTGADDNRTYSTRKPAISPTRTARVINVGHRSISGGLILRAHVAMRSVDCTREEKDAASLTQGQILTAPNTAG